MSIVAVARRVLPMGVERTVKDIRNTALAAVLRGNRFECPVCGGRFRRFLPFGSRPNAACPGCRSVERHRAAWLILQRETNLMSDQLRVLHVSPEPGLERLLRGRPNLTYVTGDLLTGDTDMVLDLTDIRAADASFDVILCSHVLEHIPDDALAMREMRRVLAPGGWALLVVPFDPAREITYEDWSITSEAGRKAAFGQEDHVRWYAGPDFEKRLEAAGWDLERVEVTDTAERARYVLDGPGVADWAVIARPE